MWIEVTISPEGEWKEIFEQAIRQGRQAKGKIWINLATVQQIKIHDQEDAATFIQNIPPTITTRIPEEISLVRQYLEAHHIAMLG